MKLALTSVEQALVATKAVNEKARTAAYSLLVEIGQSYVRWHPELTQQGFHILCCELSALTTFIVDNEKYLYYSNEKYLKQWKIRLL